MNAFPFLLAAALTPRADFHERWKWVNRAASMIAQEAQNSPAHAQSLVEALSGEFREACLAIAANGDPSRSAHLWSQHGELMDGLSLSVAECMLVGRCAGIADVESALAGIARLREERKK